MLVFGVAFALPLVVLPVVATPWARPWMFALVALPVPVAVGVAMFQRRLYDVQRAARGSLTYLALSAVLAGLYALIVGGVGVMLRDRGTPWLPWAAAGVVAVAFAPAARLAAARRDPADLRPLVHPRRGARRHRSPAGRRRGRPGAAGVADHRARRRSRPRPRGDPRRDGHTLAVAGSRPATTERLQLTAYGVEVGALLWAGRPLRPDDRALLEDLARQIGGAVHTTALVDSLHRAREELVLGREQERRRLRNDLHDGLGPSLAGLGFQVDAVQNLLAAGDDPGAQIARLREGLRETVTEVRRIVEGLRPPAIDDLGLFGAVAELGLQLADGTGLTVDLDLPDHRPSLPAAVEVAAYRVTQEALTNVVRHARATTCRVSGSVALDALVIAVTDDGVGGATQGRGVGMSSMRERAWEIGGQVEVASRECGTTVTVRLPLAVEAAT